MFRSECGERFGKAYIVIRVRISLAWHLLRANCQSQAIRTSRQLLPFALRPVAKYGLLHIWILEQHRWGFLGWWTHDGMSTPVRKTIGMPVHHRIRLLAVFKPMFICFLLLLFVILVAPILLLVSSFKYLVVKWNNRDACWLLAFLKLFVYPCNSKFCFVSGPTTLQLS